MELNREQIVKAKEILEGAKVMVLNRDFDDFQSAIITAINALTIIKELTEENEKLHERLDREARCQYNLCEQIVNLRDDIKYIKADTVLKMQKKIIAKSEYGTINISSWQLDQIVRELLEENK